MTQPEAGPVIVMAEPSSRLEALAAEYAIAKPASDAANARLNDVVAAIKNELTSMAPGSTRVDFRSPALEQPLRMSAVSQWRVDQRALKSNDYETWKRYAVYSTHWRLNPISGSPS
jgi:hypothetical protein